MNQWIPITYHKATEEEQEGYGEDITSVYDCPLPDDGQEVLITTKYGTVVCTTFYTDMGSYFEYYEDEDEVVAWMSLPDPYKPQ